MIENCKSVKREDWYPLYEKIPTLNKKIFIKIIGYRVCSNLTNKYFLTAREFEALKVFVNNFDYDSKSTILNYVKFDYEQVYQHYAALTKLISGANFQDLSVLNKAKLQNYHNTLYNQIHNG
jgi:hypothetical protein